MHFFFFPFMRRTFKIYFLSNFSNIQYGIIIVTMLYITSLFLICFVSGCLYLSVFLTNTVICGYGAWGSGSLLVTVRGDVTGILRMGAQRMESIWVLRNIVKPMNPLGLSACLLLIESV